MKNILLLLLAIPVSTLYARHCTDEDVQSVYYATRSSSPNGDRLARTSYEKCGLDPKRFLEMESTLQGFEEKVTQSLNRKDNVSEFSKCSSKIDLASIAFIRGQDNNSIECLKEAIKVYAQNITERGLIYSGILFNTGHNVFDVQNATLHALAELTEDEKATLKKHLESIRLDDEEAAQKRAAMLTCLASK